MNAAHQPDLDLLRYTELTYAATSRNTEPSTVPQLIACAPTRPSVLHVRALRRAIDLARAHRLGWPRFKVCWRAGTPDLAAGAVERDADGAFTMYLSTLRTPEQVMRTALHELKHVADLHAGLPLSREALEQRAMLFVFEVMAELQRRP